MKGSIVPSEMSAIANPLSNQSKESSVFNGTNEHVIDERSANHFHSRTNNNHINDRTEIINLDSSSSINNNLK